LAALEKQDLALLDCFGFIFGASNVGIRKKVIEFYLQH
jgi:hypothetical protein